MKKLFGLMIVLILLLTAAAAALAEDAAGVQVGDYLVFGSFDQDGNRHDGSEPIEWRVLDVKEGKAMIISRYGLTVRQYDSEVPFPTWERSNVRAWLNGTFLNTAFTAEEQACIDVTHVVTPDNSKWVEYRKETNRKYEEVSDGSEVDDKLFLLSTEEVLQLCGLNTVSEQKNNAEARELMKAVATKRAEYEGAFVYRGGLDDYKLNGEGCCWWMLRSPGHLGNHLAYVGSSGNLNSFHYTDVHRLDVCIRPVCWVDLAALQSLGN